MSFKLNNQSGILHILPLLVVIAAVGVISFLLISSAFPLNGLFGILNPKQSSHAAGIVTVTGVAVDNSSVKIFFQPVIGAKDYRVYDVSNPSNVKYAGLVHLTPNTNCPGSGCFSHFATQPDGVTPLFPYQPTGSYPNGGTGGPQVLDIPGNEIDYNGVGDNQPHTLVVEAVDQLGPTPQGNLYTEATHAPLTGSLQPGAMLGSNKGTTADGKTSTNGQGPYTNNPQVIATSQPFVVQANPNLKSIPSKSTATQTFFDSFENLENNTLKQVSRDDNIQDSFGNLGVMKYTLNAGTSKAWDLEYRRADNLDSMPFISNDHFMDVLFDGATPGTSAPTHTIYSSLAMSPVQTADMSSGRVLHMTMEVDAHQDQRRWLDFNVSPASDPLQSWDPNGSPINNTNQGVFLEIRDGGCTLDIYTGVAGSGTSPTGTAGNLASGPGGGGHGARLWGGAGAVGGAPIMCGWDQMYNPNTFSKNGLGFDDKSRYDFFLSQTHAALYQDGYLIVQSDVPAGTFPWANAPVKTYYTHYLYHSDADLAELNSTSVNGQNLCYPMNSYWFNNPISGTPASQTVCNTAYPAGYGFTYSDERHWDNMGFEVLTGADVPANNDFSTYTSLVALPPVQAPQFAAGTTAAPSSSSSPTSAPSTTPSSTPNPTTGPAGSWTNVTPSNADLINGGCGNYGTQTVVADPKNPSNLYAEFNCQGIWKSTNYGQIWTGPINTGTNGAAVGDCAGGISLAPGSGTNSPTIYEACIRGTGTGFWRSTDGGVNWTHTTIGLVAGREDYYAPLVDPYDGNHLIMAGHEMNTLVQSTDGGQTWSNIPLNAGMNQNGGTASLFFINTGNAASTRGTWLYQAQGNGGTIGTWRTGNGGVSWTKVDSNEHPHGDGQIYQPDNNGVVYMAGIYSGLGWGVLRSTDYGQTWTHVGTAGTEAIVYGTPNRVYTDYSWACGGCTVDPAFQSAPQPGITGWTNMATPTGMIIGPAQTAVVFNGTNYIIVGANWQTGLWRYVEPASGVTPSASPTCAKGPVGDIDCDGKIGVFDYNILVGNFSKTGTGLQGDIDKDGKVGVFDYNILVSNFGK